MEGRENERGAVPALRLMPASKGKVFGGAVAVVAASSFAFLVFQPLAAERAPALADVAEPAAAAAVVGPGMARSEAGRARTGAATFEMPL